MCSSRAGFAGHHPVHTHRFHPLFPFSPGWLDQVPALEGRREFLVHARSSLPLPASSDRCGTGSSGLCASSSRAERAQSRGDARGGVLCSPISSLHSAALWRAPTGMEADCRLCSGLVGGSWMETPERNHTDITAGQTGPLRAADKQPDTVHTGYSVPRNKQVQASHQTSIFSPCWFVFHAVIWCFCVCVI